MRTCAALFGRVLALASTSFSPVAAAATQQKTRCESSSISERIAAGNERIPFRRINSCRAPSRRVLSPRSDWMGALRSAMRPHSTAETMHSMLTVTNRARFILPREWAINVTDHRVAIGDPPFQHAHQSRLWCIRWFVGFAESHHVRTVLAGRQSPADELPQHWLQRQHAGPAIRDSVAVYCYQSALACPNSNRAAPPQRQA